jgi:Flp pilus assembly protein TadB
MHYQLLTAASRLAATASSGNYFHIGPWIIVPIIIVLAIIGTPIFVIRDRRKRRTEQRTR